MNAIEVPYMPVEGFDADDFLKNFSKTSSKNSREENNDLYPSEYTDDEDTPFENISLILIGMGMEKYIKLFKNENIHIDVFLNLNDVDLQELGIQDSKDREIILKNLSVHQTNKKKLIIPDNQMEDLRIIKNISNQLLLIQKYCAYVELQMRRHKLTDYIINKNGSASTYLKAFTESALIQSQIMKQSLYDEKNVHPLINKILTEKDLKLPEEAEELLNGRHKKEKCKRNFSVIKFMASISIPVIILILLGHKFISRS